MHNDEKYLIEYQLPQEYFMASNSNDGHVDSSELKKDYATLEVVKGRGPNVSPKIYKVVREGNEPLGIETESNEIKIPLNSGPTTKIKIPLAELKAIAMSPSLDQAIAKTIADAQKQGAFHTYKPLNSIWGVYGAIVVEAIEAYLLTISGYSTVLRFYLQEESVEFPQSIQLAAIFVATFYSIFKFPQIAINLGVKLPKIGIGRCAIDLNKTFHHKTALNITGTVLSAKEFLSDALAIGSGGLLYLGMLLAMGLGMPGIWALVTVAAIVVAATRYNKITLGEAGRMRELAGAPYVAYEKNNCLVQIHKQFSSTSRRLAPVVMLAAYCLTIFKWTNIFILYDLKSIKKLFDFSTPLLILSFITGEYFNLRVQDWWMIPNFNRFFFPEGQTPEPQERRLGLPGFLMDMLSSAERMIVSGFNTCIGRKQDPITIEKGILERNKKLIRAIMMFSLCSELVSLFTAGTIEPKPLKTLTAKIVTTVLAVLLPGFGYTNATKEVEQVTWPMILDLCAKHPKHIGEFFMTQVGQRALRAYLDEYFLRFPTKDKAKQVGQFSLEKRNEHKKVSVALNKCNNFLLKIGDQLNKTAEKQLSARDLTTYVINGLMRELPSEAKESKRNAEIDNDNSQLLIESLLPSNASSEILNRLIGEFLTKHGITDYGSEQLEPLLPLVQGYVKATIQFTQKVTTFVNDLLGNPRYQQRKGCSRLAGLFACYNPDNRPIAKNSKTVSASGVVTTPVDEDKLLTQSNINQLWQIPTKYPALTEPEVQLIPTTFSMNADL